MAVEAKWLNLFFGKAVPHCLFAQTELFRKVAGHRQSSARSRENERRRRPETGPATMLEPVNHNHHCDEVSLPMTAPARAAEPLVTGSDNFPTITKTSTCRGDDLRPINDSKLGEIMKPGAEKIMFTQSMKRGENGTSPRVLAQLDADPMSLGTVTNSTAGETATREDATLSDKMTAGDVAQSGTDEVTAAAEDASDGTKIDNGIATIQGHQNATKQTSLQGKPMRGCFCQGQGRAHYETVYNARL